MKKKVISTMMALALCLSMSATVFATEVTPDTGNTANTNLSYIQGAAYTVTIPASVTLDGSQVTVSAEDVALEAGYELNVTITATSGENNAFTVAYSDDTLAYTVEDDGGASYALDDEVLTVAAGNATGSTTLIFDLEADESAVYAATYTGTMTFTVSVDAAD